MPSKKKFVWGPEHWRFRAEEARTVADPMTHEEARTIMRRNAVDYDRLAKIAEAQIRNVVVCHLSVGRCEYAFRSTPASGSPARCAPLPKPRISACSTFNRHDLSDVRRRQTARANYGP